MKLLNFYPSYIHIGKIVPKPFFFAATPKFDPHTYITICPGDHSVYLAGCHMLSNIFSAWYIDEKATANKLNQEVDEYAWVNYLDTMALGNFCTEIGLKIFNNVVTREYSTSIITRFIDCETQAKMMIDPVVLSAIRGRMMYSLITCNSDYVRNQKAETFVVDDKLCGFVNDPTLYNLISVYPWLWLIPAYQLSLSLLKITELSVKA